MKLFKLPQLVFLKILGFFVGFLTWFIRLVTFIGDVTIWSFRALFWGFAKFFKKILRLDFSKNIPGPKVFGKILKSRAVSGDLSFKVGIITIFALLAASWFVTKDLPSPRQLSTRDIPQTTKIYDRNGKLLYNVYTDENRTIVPLSEIPDHFKNATIAIEDKDFYKHKGFDVYGIVRAGRSTVFAGDLQGGSTITQQLVKSVFLTPERTISRKLKELYLAFRVEMAFSKDQILEMYMNQVPYGGTAWGASAAAEQYFDKSLSELTLAESSFLAGLPQAPSYYSPFGGNLERSKERQRQVLSRMVEDHFISAEEAEAAASEDLQFQSANTDIQAPHFVMFIRDYLAEKYGETVATKGGLKVTTTVDLDVQNIAQEAVSKNVAAVANLHVTNGAAIVTKPKTGEILAMVGSKDFFDAEIDGNVNLTTALRQPGSSIKPINYVAGLESKKITAATVVMDVPTTFTGGPQPYKPVNYDGKFRGPVQIRYALGNSLNIPAVKVLALNGVNEMINMARAMGITTFTDPSRYGLSLTLGGGEVKMVDMATAFGVFANEGLRVDLTPVLKVEDSEGNILEEFKPKAGERVLSGESSFLISSILSDNTARSAAFGTGSKLVVRGKNVAVKTGTTDDKRDNWTFGYTPSYLVGTWVGNNDNTPMNQNLASGVTGAAPIWNDIMTKILEDKINETFKVPSGVRGMEICSLTGGVKSEGCPGRFEYFISGTQPNKDTYVKAKVWVDKSNGKVVPAGSENAEEREEYVISDIYRNESFCASCPQVLPSPSPTPTPVPTPNP